MKVLVTGGTSLLARRTAEALLARGDDVTVLQRHSSPLDCAQVLADVRDGDAVHRAVDGCDAVIHAAAKVGVVGTWDEYRTINVDGTANVMAAARFHGVSRVVYVSTPSVAHAGDSLVGAAAEAPVTDGAARGTPSRRHRPSSWPCAPATMSCPSSRSGLIWCGGRATPSSSDESSSAPAPGGWRWSATARPWSTRPTSTAPRRRWWRRSTRPCPARAAWAARMSSPTASRDRFAIWCWASAVPRASTCSRATCRCAIALSAGSIVEKIWSVRHADDEPPLTRFLAEQLGTAHWFDPRPARDDLGWTPPVSIDEGLAALATWFRTESLIKKGP